MDYKGCPELSTWSKVLKIWLAELVSHVTTSSTNSGVSSSSRSLRSSSKQLHLFVQPKKKTQNISNDK